MAFNFQAFVGGAAERASEIMEEERQDAKNIVDQSMRVWTELGVPAYKERQAKKKDLSMKFKTLSDEKFTPDQIEVIARQGKTDAVLAHIDAMKKSNIEVKPADVVTFSDAANYKDTGRTIDQVLESYMGKVNAGMSVSDAIVDSGGSSKGFLGQDLTGLMKARAETFGAAMGYDPATLRALAQGDIEMSDAAVRGTVTLLDPVAEKAAKDAIRGSSLNQSTKNKFDAMAGKAFGVAMSVDPITNEFRIEGGTNEDQQNAMILGAQAIDKYNEFMASGEMTEGMAQAATYKWIQATAPTMKGQRGENNSGRVGDPPDPTLNVSRAGDSLAEITNAFATDMEGVTDTEIIQQIYNAAYPKLVMYYTNQENMTSEDAQKAAESELARLMGS